MEIRINESLFSEARVIACTLVGSANRLLTGQKFGTVFIDEAAQALELAKEKTGDANLKMEDLRQEDDCLDTWFSSWLWPISLLQ